MVGFSRLASVVAEGRGFFGGAKGSPLKTIMPARSKLDWSNGPMFLGRGTMQWWGRLRVPTTEQADLDETAFFERTYLAAVEELLTRWDAQTSSPYARQVERELEVAKVNGRAVSAGTWERMSEGDLYVQLWLHPVAHPPERSRVSVDFETLATIKRGTNEIRWKRLSAG
jgi:hypothetical protein